MDIELSTVKHKKENKIKHKKDLSRHHHHHHHHLHNCNSYDGSILRTMKRPNILQRNHSYDPNFRYGSKNTMRKTKAQNIIISKYPIVTNIYAELDRRTQLDDIIGARTVIGANISIYGNIISVYNTALNKDIKTSNIINVQIREKEVESLFDIIDENKAGMDAEIFNSYVKTNIHFLLGTLNINEYDRKIR